MARVLHVVLSLNPGGTERLVIELARRLHSEIPAAVCCLDEAGTWARELTSQGIEVTVIGRRPGFRPMLGRAVAKAARAHGATVIHAHHYSPFVYAAIARLFHPGLRLIFTEHGRLSDAPPSPRRRLANRFLRHLATEVFAVSADVKRHLVGEGFRAERVGVIYNGIEIGPLPDAGERSRVREALGVSEEDFVIGTVARLDPVKDLGTLIDAFSALHPSGRRAVLVIIGDGPERAALERRAAAHGVAGLVQFLGFRDDARDWLAGFDVYANSSISEGVSLTILEAMAAGLPIVATRVGGTPEVVTEECGVLVPAGDVSSLAGSLSSSLLRVSSQEALRPQSRARVELCFALDRMVAAYRQTYLAISGAAS